MPAIIRMHDTSLSRALIDGAKFGARIRNFINHADTP